MYLCIRAGFVLGPSCCASRKCRRLNWIIVYFAHLPQQCHNSKRVIFRERLLKFIKYYNFLWVKRRHNCSSAASFANYIMTLNLLKAHLQTFHSIPLTQKCQILSCDTLVANERFNTSLITSVWSWRWACMASHCHGLVPRWVSRLSQNNECYPIISAAAAATYALDGTPGSGNSSRHTCAMNPSKQVLNVLPV